MKPPIQFVVCFETDDYACPRGYTLPQHELYEFDPAYASVDCPAGVSEGRVYAVDSEHRVLGEALIPPTERRFVANVRRRIERTVIRWGPMGRPW